MDIRSLMHRAVSFNRDREAIVHGSQRLTFTESWRRGLRLANALLALGLKPGDRVGSLEDNGIPAADFFVAAAIANIVRVPLYPRNSAETHGHMLGHTGCRRHRLGCLCRRVRWPVGHTTSARENYYPRRRLRKLASRLS